MKARIWMLLAALLLAPALAASGDAPSPQHGGDGVLKLMGNLMFWEYVTFGIVLLVLGVGVLPKLLKQLGDRQSRIQDALDKADKVRAEAEVLLKKHEEMMRNAHLDAQKITDEARSVAKEAAAAIHAQAEAASREIKDRAQREIELQRKKAEAELREAAVELALLAGSRVLERALSGDDHRKLAREAVEAAGNLKN
ncbi:MAG: F0F1 ATP synthase subunit B [Planctomycetes bacterium]|nr:F0F1 ATP synthase subunit B [Planctomycetota bacterium]